MMSRRQSERDGKRDLARRALERSTEGLTPDMSRLLDAVPGLVDRARRRRSRTEGDPISELVPLAWKALPRLAAAAALLVLISAGFYLREIGAESEVGESAELEVESLLLTGTWSGSGENPLLEAILSEDDSGEKING